MLCREEQEKKMNQVDFPFIVDAQYFSDKSLTSLIEYIIKENVKLNTLLDAHGAILYRGFRVDTMDDFECLVSKTMRNCRSYVGGDSPRTKLSNTIYTSTEYPAHQSIVLHNELSFSNDYPRYMYFYCLIPAKIGGETPLANNRELYKRLPKSLIEKYHNRKLKYIMNLHDGYGMGRSWQDAFETKSKIEVDDILKRRNVNYSWQEDGTLKISEIIQPIIRHPNTQEWLFFSQAHQWHPSNLDAEVRTTLLSLMPETDFYHYVCHADDGPLDIDELELTRKLIDELKIAQPWQQGDVLFIDNMLVMHGRNPFEGERKILLSLMKEQ